MKNIAKIAIAALLALSVTGCNDYFHEINWPHGGLTEEDLDRDNLRQGSMLPTMELLIVPMGSAGAFQHCESLVGDVWGRTLMSKPGGNGSTSAWSGDFSWYHPDGDHWLSNPFTATMAFYNPYVETWKFTEHDSNNSIWALTRIMRVAVMHRLADMYGPIPYTAIDPEDLDLYMPYDTEEVAWKAMLLELSTAIDDLKNCIELGTGANIENFDRIYQGDLTKWLKYANSLLLRLAVRVSNVAPELTVEYAQKAVNGGVIDSNADNAIMHMKIGRMANIGSQLYNVAYGTYNDSFAAADLVCYMNGYKDNRRSAYFTTYKQEDMDGNIQEIYYGLRAGSSAGEADVRSFCSRPNVDQYSDYPLLTAAEVSFLLAECALKNWVSGDAQALYENGIRLSFEQWGVSGAASYIANTEDKPAEYEDLMENNEDYAAPSQLTIAWAADGKELQRIITQKYIAMYPLGHETWCDFRRTGYPEFLPVFKSSKGPAAIYENMKVANRLKFSVDESTQNRENLNTAITYLNGSDDYLTKLWWAKN